MSTNNAAHTPGPWTIRSKDGDKVTFDPKQTQFVRAKPGTFEEKVARLESRFERVLDHPVTIAALVLLIYAVAVCMTAGFLGWRP